MKTLPAPLDKKQGCHVIQEVVKTLPTTPGVYRMLRANGDVLYVGKAKNLKNRVSAYTQIEGLSKRHQNLIRETASMEIVTTATEAEALLLETNLIQKLQPRYNILLKDGKSLAYIIVTQEEWPLLTKQRRPLPPGARVFGPFLSAQVIQQTLRNLYRIFLLRSCRDTIFKNRTRPCLQYDIKRCSAPCVKKISSEAYEALVQQALQFLSGKSSAVQKELAQEMEQLSANQAYENAAAVRDRIQILSQVQMQQKIHALTLKEGDVIAIYHEGGASCIQVFSFRNGAHCGASAFFPNHGPCDKTPDILQAFLMQFYANLPLPSLILLNEAIPDLHLVIQVLGLQKSSLQVPQQGRKKRLVLQALLNAQEALKRHNAKQESLKKILENVAQHFHLHNPPHRIEVYDNSHLQGTYAVGAMIVAGPEGFIKNAYRKFLIRGHEKDLLTPGDDLGMMREVFHRRFQKMTQDARDDLVLPDLILVDGGKGQLRAAQSVLADLKCVIPVVAIAKGPKRNAGQETFFMENRDPFQMDFKDPTLYYLQQLRDEAHRYGILSHRQKRLAGTQQSRLSAIAGVGHTRKRALLKHFGSIKGVQQASVLDLESVSGVSKALAKKIYDYFQSNG